MTNDLLHFTLYIVAMSAVLYEWCRDLSAVSVQWRRINHYSFISQLVLRYICNCLRWRHRSLAVCHCALTINFEIYVAIKLLLIFRCIKPIAEMQSRKLLAGVNKQIGFGAEPFTR